MSLGKRISKAQARKRCQESSDKLLKVLYGYRDLTPAEVTKIGSIHRDLRKLVMKFK